MKSMTSRSRLVKLLKIFVDKLLDFCEAIEVFSKTKSITWPNVSGLNGLPIENLHSLILS